MTEVGIDTLQEHLKQAREGERIVITENGRSIALIYIEDGHAPARLGHLVW